MGEFTGEDLNKKQKIFNLIIILDQYFGGGSVPNTELSPVSMASARDRRKNCASTTVRHSVFSLKRRSAARYHQPLPMAHGHQVARLSAPRRHASRHHQVIRQREGIFQHLVEVSVERDHAAPSDHAVRQSSSSHL